MPTYSAALPATRTTGGTDAADPAADVNLLTAAITEVRTSVPDPVDTSTHVESTTIRTLVSLTEAEYAAIATPDPETLYVVV